MSAATDWALEIDRAWAEQLESLHDAVAYVGQVAVKRIDDRSPVKFGRFRANWALTIGAPDTSTTTALDPSGTATVSRNLATLAGYPEQSFPAIYLQNNLPYAERLETGHSTQAPGGMVGITYAELAALWEGTEL